MPEARCPVCAEAAHAASTRCTRCHAPHHPECWAYLGGCGRYACRGRTAQGVGWLRRPLREAAARRGALAVVGLLALLPVLGELSRCLR